MLEIARHEVPEAELIEADFTQIPLATMDPSTSSSPSTPSSSRATGSPRSPSGCE
jgi:hypothetical protein